MRNSNIHDWIKLLLLPSLCFFFVAWFINYTEFDLKVADFLYGWEGGEYLHQWPLRNAFLERYILHDYGHHLVVIAAISLLFITISSRYIIALTPYKNGFLYLLLSFIITVVIVGILKKTTHVNCPWDLIRYGGLQPLVGTFDALPSNVKPGHCFPGGHATGGYGWIGLFYFCRMYFPKWRWLALLIVLGLGITFDVTQQLRGAHFLSHGMWTLAISWWICTLLYLLYFKKITLKLAY